jgi:predicted AlkP superfamily pyrophosphatase or phosphodiesterase
MNIPRLFVAAVLVSLLAPGMPAQEPTPRPRLILVLSIDQMRFDYLPRFQPLYTGGLKTLLDGAAVFTNAYYRHASTETGPGHAVILTGMHPSHSGIVANEWWDSFRKTAVNVVDDPVQGTLGGEGRKASPANLLGFTVGDVLKQASPASRVVGVSAKDRSAILMAGRRGNAAYWFENAGGNFVTSTYYTNAVPPWLTAFNAQHIPARYAGRAWTRIADQPSYDTYAGPDAVPTEADGKDTVFPHNLPQPPDSVFYGALRSTPFLDEIILDASLAAMNAHGLGQDEATDILAIGFSATDGVGHRYGPQSQEVMDQLLRLDRLLDTLFKHIDRAIGPNNTVVVLTADHGALPLVEELAARGEDARRVPPATLLASVNRALADRFPGVGNIVAYFAGDVYLDTAVMQRHNLSRDNVEKTIKDALLRTGVVAEVYLRQDLLGDGRSKDPYIGLFRNAFFLPRSPDLTIRLKERYFLSGQSRGTGHGSVYEYDRHVPVIFYGPGIKGGRYDAPSGPEDIAPTLAQLLGFPYPMESDSRVLTEALITAPGVY